MRLLLFLLFLTVGCDGDFGEKTEKFVNKEVPGLSKKLAETGLERKLYQSYVVEFSKLMLEAQNIFRTLVRHEPDTEFSVEKMGMQELQNFRHRLFQHETELLHLKSYLLTIRAEQERLKELCTTMDEGFLREVVKAEIFQVAVPDKVEEYYIGNDLIKTLVENIKNQFTSNSQAKQIAIMEDALNSLPDKMPARDKLRQIYTEKCFKAQADFQAQEEIVKFEETFLKMLEVLDQNIALNQKFITIVGTRIYQLAYQELYSKYGVDSIDESEAQINYNSKVTKLYAELIEQDQSIMSALLKKKSRTDILSLKQDWDRVYKDRMILLTSVKGKWPFYHEKHELSVARKRFVDLVVEKVLTKGGQ